MEAAKDNESEVISRSPYHTPKMKWSKDEDEKLIKAVNENGAKNWSFIATFLHGRNGKQCRERWLTNLSPDVNLEPWTPAEDLLLIQMHKKYENKWSTMAPCFDGRSPIAIKNRWKYLDKRKIPQCFEEQQTNLKEGSQFSQQKLRQKPKKNSDGDVISINNIVIQVPDEFETNQQDFDEISRFDEWLVF